MTPEDIDPQLVELSRSIDDFVNLSTKDGSQYAILCIGGKMNETSSETHDGLQTCLAAGGKLEIIEETLYAELANQILSGDGRLFFMISNVLAALDEQLGEKIQSLEEEEDNELFEEESLEFEEHPTADDSDGKHILKSADDFLGEFDLDSLEGLIIVTPESNRKH